jgi:hypothetical protein
MNDGRPLGRAISVLAAALTAAVVVVTVQPVGAHVTEKFGHLWTQHIREKGDARWEAKDTIRQFGQIRMDGGDLPVTLAEAGPFTLEARCNESISTTTAQIELITSEQHSSYRSTEDNDEDFNPGEGANWGQTQSAPTTTVQGDADEQGHALAPSGWAIDGRAAIYTNFDGADCVFAGYVIVTGRP